MKKKNKKYHIVETVPQSNRKIVERDRIDTPNTHSMIAHFPCLA